MKDIGPPEIHLWHHIEKIVRRLYSNVGFQEVRTPLLESTQLFHRGVGEGTDIVEKEMYTFTDRNEESVSLRPEGTASVVRALLEHQWHSENSVEKYYYFGPMFRHERPQKGRFRQHYQYGLEIFGVDGPYADIEIISTQTQLFQKLELTNITLRISSVGCRICRPPYKEKLLSILKSKFSELCADCQRRVEKNPLRVFDCKIETCKKLAETLPTMLEHLCEACVEHFAGVQSGLKNLAVSFEVDPQIVRGIDYYTRTCFEFISGDLGAQSTVCGGGRYDHLVSELGGGMIPGVGCGMGMERLALLLEARVSEFLPKPLVYFVTADEVGRVKAYELCFHLRGRGVRADIDLLNRSMKAQMRAADKSQAKYSVVIGSNELQSQEVAIKKMSDGTKTTIRIEELLHFLSST